jgi:ectoine hydroxylase
LNWSKDGYLILESFFDSVTCSATNEEIDQLLKNQKLQFTYGNKLMFANKKSSLIKKITNDKALKEILGFILDKEVIPFQTINFLQGSQQRAHSDSIHMTTYPLGY